MIPLFPLLAAIGIGLFGRRLAEGSHRAAIPAVLLSSALSLKGLIDVAQGGPRHFTLYPWISNGSIEIAFGFYIDHLTVVVLLLITGVSSVIQCYSVRYMRGDPGYSRFFAGLSFFTASILMMVMADNLLMLYLFWEVVGFALYLLLAHHFERKAACRSAFKSFLVNRTADALFFCGLLLAFQTFGTFDYRQIFLKAETHLGKEVNLLGWFGLSGPSVEVFTLIALLIFAGGAGKSAQFPFHVWLPDTMEGPTPVSALMHAGMVNAGGFMVARLSPLFELSTTAMNGIALIGATTAFLGTAIMLTQSDIKRVLGYSTMGQMGFMVMEVGLGAYSAALLHLVAHGLFKATLFLNAGNALEKARKHSAAAHGAPAGSLQTTFGIQWAAGLAAALIFPALIYLGFDPLLRAPLFGWEGGVLLWFFGWATAFLTAFYLFQLIYADNLRPRAGYTPVLHSGRPFGWKAAVAMILILAVFIGGYAGAAVIGWNWFEGFLAPVLKRGEHLEGPAAGWGLLFPVLLSTAVVLSGWFLSYSLLNAKKILLPHRPDVLSKNIYLFLLNEGYVDEVYHSFLIAPILNLSRRLAGIRDRSDLTARPSSSTEPLA